MDSFSEYFNKLVNSSLSSQHEKSSDENISLLKQNLFTKDEKIKKLVGNQNTEFLTLYQQSLTINIQTL